VFVSENIVSTGRELKQAITVLEANRTVLGDALVDLSVTVLREKLNAVQRHPARLQHQQMTVLVADLSGFTAMAELLDAEEVRDTINAVWEKLDSVIEAWGGRIDKHTGDGMIALFGVPTAHDDDPERAIQAALDMQMELTLFNERAKFLSGAVRTQWPHHFPDLRMRIGVNIGPILFSKVGTSSDYTAVGDTVRAATQLEELAPVGGVLISHDVYQRVHPLFDVDALDSIEAADDSDLLPLYIVKREKHGAFRISMRSIEGVETHMVGRNSDLERLQRALQETIDDGAMQVVTISGAAGVGKSRLLFEFERWLALQPSPVRLFKGQADQQSGQLPYALIRDLFANQFDIHPRNSPAVAREKLVRGIVGILQESKSEEEAREQAHFIGQLLGFNFNESVYLQEIVRDPHRVREYAFYDLAHFFKAAVRESPAAVLFFENAHWADEGSLDLIDHLVHECQEVPLLVVVLARPSLIEKRPSWQVMESTHTASYARLNLQPLSPIDSRHLVTEILHNVPDLPLRLTDLIVNGAEGNPFRIEETIKLLIEDEVILKEEGRWRVQMGKLSELPSLPTLADLLQVRLDRLSAVERVMLQTAAVLGHLFADSAVMQLVQLVDDSVAADQIASTFPLLEQKGLVYRRRVSTLVDAQEYRFRHEDLRRLVYDSIEAERRAVCHAQAADWLRRHSHPHLDDFAGRIARHFELAGDTERAAEWYGRAGQRAQDLYAPQTAIERYRCALNLLPMRIETAAQRVNLNEGLGQMLHWQARFAEAIDAFDAMQTAAHAAGDRKAEARAFQGRFLAQSYQADYAAALVSAQQAEAVARAVDSREDLAMALAAKGWALMFLGKVDQTLALGQEALVMAKAATAQRQTAYSYFLLGAAYRVLRRYERAVQMIEEALLLFRQLGDRHWEAIVLRNLGRIKQARRDYPTAIALYRDSLRIARGLGDHYGVMRYLQDLANMAQRQGDYIQAEQYYRRALLFAEISSSVKDCAHIANDLGEMHLTQAVIARSPLTELERDERLRQARIWFERAFRLAGESGGQLVAALAQLGMARLLTEEERLEDALIHAKKVFAIVKQTPAMGPGTSAARVSAVAWRTIGLIACKLPQDRLPIPVGAQSYDAADCFAKSLHILSGMEEGAELERARTLRAWATLELHQGSEERGTAFLQQALSIFNQLGVKPGSESDR
jgi:class 3 adenylate cyclase/tetratricopeptide (TPR) repeat protein